MAIKWSKEDLEVAFLGIEDPRVDRTKKYPLSEILFLVLLGSLMGVESWRGIEMVGGERLSLLRLFFPYENGVPSHQTIGRVFSLFKPKAFESFFTLFSSTLSGSLDGKQIAIDGKTMRGSYDKASGQKALHILNVCAVDSGLSLAQLQVDEKTNEITAVPEILELLDVKGSNISVDALNTQKNLAEIIISKKADYTLALKGNHKNLNEEVNFIFDTNRHNDLIQSFETTEKGHGRVTNWINKIIPITEEILPEKKEWKGLKAIGRTETTSLRNGKETFETRNYLLSYEDAETFATSARNHWAVENKLHWSLDVIFNEDGSRKRSDNAPRNYAVIRKLALNILRTNKGKISVPLMKHKVSLNPEFLVDILKKTGISQEHASKLR